ncbi:MAG: hypothetical protein IJ807_01420 [Eubacterium sp.]|nr:hypothetical protein [Eubacterium sp.]
MAVSDHAILSQTEIDNLIAQLAKATEKSYNEGFQAANEVIAKSEENVDYSTGYNQGLKIGYERGVSDAWDIIKNLLARGNEELDILLQKSSIDISMK